MTMPAMRIRDTRKGNQKLREQISAVLVTYNVNSPFKDLGHFLKEVGALNFFLRCSPSHVV